MSEIRRPRGRRKQAASTADVQTQVQDASDVVRMTAWVEQLASAMVERDARAVTRMMKDPLATRLPSEVREEATMFSALGKEALRAPINTLRHLHVLRQLVAEEQSGAPRTQLDLFGKGKRGRGI